MQAGSDERVNNPLFNSNRLKLGLFAFNGVGNTISNLPPRDASWPTNLRVATIADGAGLEALVSYARWKGVPRPEPLPFVPHDAFESFTWASALAQATRRIAVLATVHIPMMHPVLVAKMATTVDHVSNGRSGINVVAGWNGPEFRMFGKALKEHDDRYAEGAEWMEILRRLWTEREFDFDGTYYTIERGESFPKPLQKPHPPIMNAGGSAAGRAFAAKYADLCFVMVGQDGFDVAREQIARYRELARREHGKEIAVWTYTDVILPRRKAKPTTTRALSTPTGTKMPPGPWPPRAPPTSTSSRSKAARALPEHPAVPAGR